MTGLRLWELPARKTRKSCKTISTKTFYISSICAYIGVCIWLLFSYLYEGQVNVVVCPMKLIYHIPCPGCGVTRATLLFFHGQIAEAVSLNPNVIFSIGFICVFPMILGYDAITQSTLLYKFFYKIDSFLKNKWVFILFIGFELFVWIHNIVCHV